MPVPPVPASLKSSVNATKVEYVQLGSSGLRVSRPILGTMGMGSKDWQTWVMEEDESLEILKAAWDRGK
jgi:aryl-alcohol dehydrogenase-like predicted oxidoreductase